MIKANVAPLSFTDVRSDLYTQATLGVYELNRVELLKDVFLWAYERSAARYIAEVVRGALGRKAAAGFVRQKAQASVPEADREQFIEVAETELLGLHDGNFARYQVRPSECAAWQAEWNAGR